MSEVFSLAQTATSENESATQQADDDKHGSLLNTVVVSLTISILSLVIAAFNFYWTSLRPPDIHATLTLITATTRGGPHITVPTSISNSGARPATVLNAKLLENGRDQQSLWGAEFETSAADALQTFNGAALNDKAAIFVPFLVPPNGEVQTVLIFIPAPTPGFSTTLLARGGKTFRYTLVLETTVGDVVVSKTVTWLGVTDGALDKRAFGVANATDDVNAWFNATTPQPAANPTATIAP